MEYGGANLVPIALPRFCLNVLSKNWKKLFLKTISANSTKESVVNSLFSLLFKCLMYIYYIKLFYIIFILYVYLCYIIYIIYVIYIK